MTIFNDGEMKLYYFNKKYLSNAVSNYHEWFADPLVTKHNSHGLFPMSEAEMEGFFESIDNNEVIVFAIEVDEKHIGNVSLQRIDYINSSAEIAIVLGEPDYWGQGYGYKACAFAVKHAMEKLNIHRVWSGTSAENIGMQRVFEKLRFEREGIFKNGMFNNGKYIDVYEYGLTRK